MTSRQVSTALAANPRHVCHVKPYMLRIVLDCYANPSVETLFSYISDVTGIRTRLMRLKQSQTTTTEVLAGGMCPALICQKFSFLLLSLFVVVHNLSLHQFSCCLAYIMLPL